MDAITCQALLIRYAAALTEVNHTDEAGRLDLLRHVLQPSPELEKISLAEANRVGASFLAKKMSRRREAA